MKPTSRSGVHQEVNYKSVHGQDNVKNFTAKGLKDDILSINHLEVFPHIPDEIKLESPSGSQSQTPLCLPMLSASVDVSIDGMVACAELTQKFINSSDILIPEARHSFPLYGGAVVTSFDCTIGDERHLRGCVKPTQLAKDEFNKAKTSRKRHAAALLEELTPEMFETALGNIPPQTIVTVKLKYVYELEVVVMKDEKSEGLAITIPSSIAPCYGGSASRTSRRDPKPAEEGLKIDIRVADSGIIDADSYRIESGHDVDYQGTQPAPRLVAIGGLAEVAKLQAKAPETPRMQSVWYYASASPVLKKDFILVIQLRAEHMLCSRAVIEPADSKGLAAMMVSLRPTDLFGSAVRPQAFVGELLFLLDRSSSMGLAEDSESTIKIDTMRGAMELALSGLPDMCAFNIISFGSEVRGMWPQSRPASDSRNIGEARTFLSHVAADMGGTEVLQALKAATATRLQSRDSTQIILITDGEVYEPQEPILQFVWEKRQQLGDKVRFFTLGIGDQVSHHIMESIAELGGGYCDVVDVVKRPYWENRLNRILRSAMEPNSWSCEVALGPGYHNQSLVTTRFALPGGSDQSPNQTASVPYVQAPYPVPQLQPYRYKSLFFLLDLRGGSTPPSITITTTTPGTKTREYTLNVESTSFNTRTIHHLAVKAVLVGLENETKREVGETNIMRANAEYLGTEYTIASKWTSFVAVEGDAEEQEQTVKVDMYLAPVLESLADGLLSLETDNSTDDDYWDVPTKKAKKKKRTSQMVSTDVVDIELPSRKKANISNLDSDDDDENRRYTRDSVSADRESISSRIHQSVFEEEHTSITWRSAVRCQQNGLFCLDETLRKNLRVHMCVGAAERLEEQVSELITHSRVLGDEAIVLIVDTLMMISYFETHLAAERDSWNLLMGKAEREVLLLLGFGEDEDKVLAPLCDMLTRSIAHVHFNVAVYSASVERQSGSKRDGNGATMKTCPVCDVDFDAGAWPECRDRAFVCCNDDCYGEQLGGRMEFDNWDLFRKHQVDTGHLCCPEVSAT
ncbi:hypothetical protein CIB48_g5525 [Xylaria polymorpha]|nr:hypothetical protein CIB48_g5525 [Xylaria polymorpha]